MTKLQKENSKEVDVCSIWEDDLLNRQSEAKNLIKIISSIKQPFTITIESKFGTGKSYFLERLSEEFKEEQKFSTIMLNIWLLDYNNLPLFTLVAEILDYLEQHEEKLEIENQFSDFKDKLLVLFKSVSLGLVEKCLSGAITGEEVKEIFEHSTLISDEVAKYKSLKESIETFKKSLQDICNKIRESTGKPFVIIIDELDRCRPDYTLEVMECVKHFLEVDNLIIIIGIDKGQLLSSIESVYGTQYTQENFLNKFIDWEYQLKEPNNKDYINNLTNSFKFEDIFIENGIQRNNGLEIFKQSLLHYTKLFNLSNRQINQFFTKANLIYRLFESEDHLYPSLTNLLILIKDIDYNIYDKYTKNPKNESQVIDFIKSYSGGSELIETGFGDDLLIMLIVFAAPDTNYLKEIEKERDLNLYTMEDMFQKVSISSTEEAPHSKYIRNIIESIYSN